MFSVHRRCRLLHVKFLENCQRPRPFQCKAPNVTCLQFLFLFIIDVQVQFYKCVEHEKLKCQATGRLENQSFSIKANQAHNHDDHTEELQKYKVLYSMKEKVASSNAPPLEVYDRELARFHFGKEYHTFAATYFSFRFSDNMMSHVNYDNTSSVLRGIRQRAHPRCSNDLELYELLTEDDVFAEQYGMLRGRNWFQTMLVEETDSCILFLVEQIIIPPMCTLFFDGTFRTRPKFYATQKGQIFNMFVEANGKVRFFFVCL